MLQEWNEKEVKSEDLFNVYTRADMNKEEVLTNPKIKQSMFPQEIDRMRDVYKIQHSMRVLPHDQNTGGFFIAVFKKHKDTTKLLANDLNQKMFVEENNEEDVSIKPEDNVIEIVAEKNETKPKQNNNKDKHKINWLSFEQEEPEHWAEIKQYYGLQDFPSDRLFIQNKGDKVVSFVSSSIKNFITWDVKKQINSVYVGIKTFERVKGSYHKIINENSLVKENVIYRPLQSAIDTLWPFMTKRKMTVTFNEF